ncbi:class I SAM-dependent methyltransferase [Microcoleus sp.]|uniref:class I SAM-dependent methyltransferase n=1 Tax=Microcoleus sp. TaxID=44472 RepID=UPI00352382AB
MKSSEIESLYYSGRYYDAIINCAAKSFKERNVPFWVGIAKKYINSGSRVLELACGTGRIAIPLAKEQFKVTGIDLSDSMLESAKSKSFQVSDIEYIKGDIKSFSLSDKFSMIVLAEDAFSLLLEIEELESCLACIREHLEIDGIFIIDVLNPSPDYLLDISLCKKTDISAAFNDPEGNGIVTVTRSREYDAANQIVIMKLCFQLPNHEKEIVEEHKLRVYFPKELEILLKYNGFIIKERFGDYDETPFSSASTQQIIVCQAAQ